MERVRIKWSDRDYDMRFEKGDVLVEEETGVRVPAIIIMVLCGIALVPPLVFTVIQMLSGTASGNPVGAIIAVSLVLGSVILWGVRQFFSYRRFHFQDGAIHFEFAGLFGKKKVIVSMAEYDQLAYGHNDPVSRNSGGYNCPGFYFLTARHKNPRYRIIFYKDLQEQISQDRIERYSKMLGLPAMDTTAKNGPSLLERKIEELKQRQAVSAEKKA